jgi:hypothetical protein
MRLTPCAPLAFLALLGCETQQQTVDNMQPEAVRTAQQRGSFELR